jgi:hypothetical protein
MVAMAATAYSDWGYYGPFSGYSYKNQASVSNDGRLYAGTSVSTQDGSAAPTGYMGVQARLFNSSQLCDYTIMDYNSGPAAGMGLATEDSCGAGTYYSAGFTEAYNGNGYNNYSTFESPRINN